MGKSSSSAGIGNGHHDRMEAHRGSVGEKIGKSHLTYGQGAAAEITAMCTIGAGLVWTVREHDARVVIRRGWHHAANRTGLQ